jgi:ComF family protein
MLHALWEGFCDLVAPQRCAACGVPVEDGHPGFCNGCALLLDPLPAREPSALDHAACRYGGPLSLALHALKYRGDTTRVPALADLLVAAASPLRGRIDLVTCVPLHPRRLRERGFNQAALLAAPVAHALGAPFRPGLLARARDVPHQVGASRAARSALAEGSVTLRRGVPGACVLVVDDVRTTGSTLLAVRGALLAGGASCVYSLVLAEADAA